MEKMMNLQTNVTTIFPSMKNQEEWEKFCFMNTNTNSPSLTLFKNLPPVYYLQHIL